MHIDKNEEKSLNHQGHQEHQERQDRWTTKARSPRRTTWDLRHRQGRSPWAFGPGANARDWESLGFSQFSDIAPAYDG